LKKGALWIDGNSCAPATKRRAAEVIEAAGARYVDLAIMAPVHPRRHRTPGLLAGPHATQAMTELAALNMDWRVAGPMVGDASSIKMLRSVMIKGFEALCAECLLAARRAGVEDAVLASLQASDPGWVWHERGAYNLERMMVHGARRAAEMREVAATLRDLGLSDRMAAATAQWQDQIAALRLPGGPDDLADRADRILSKLP
jgi:3-hydroxyisobutyrate dehydrogenase-like beta-hydroxyacid dehydrogenase